MGRGKQLSDFQVTQIHKLKASGFSLRKISEKLGRSYSVVGNVLRLGDNYRKPSNYKGRKPKLSEKEVELIRHLAATGKKSIREIQRELLPSVSVGTVHRVISCSEYLVAAKKYEEEPEMARCFFCLSCNPEDFQRISTYNVPDGRIKILLKYLLHTRNNKNEQLLKQLTAMLEESRNSKLKQSGNSQGFLTCDKCKKDADHIAGLHQELEKTQMKIVHGLKLFQKKILQYFSNGSSGEESCKILQSLVAEPFKNETPGADKRELKRLLEVIVDFQMAVNDKEKEAMDVPCVILEKFAFTNNNKISNIVEDLNFHTAVKTEINCDVDANDEGIDVFANNANPCDDDINPSDSEYNILSSPTPNNAAAIPKLKLKKNQKHCQEQSQDASCEPTVECKLEVEEPRVKRRRQTSPVSLLTSKAGRSSKVDDPRVKRKSNRPKKYKKRIKEVSPKKKYRAKAKQKKKKVVNRRKMVCELCSFSNKTKYVFERHLITHEDTLSNSGQSAQYTCDRCSKSFYGKQLHAFHMEGHGKTITITCDSCNERIPYSEVESHARTHTEKIFTCVNCSFCCTTRRKYLFHLTYHGKGRLECDICSKPYHTKAKLLQHLYEEHQIGKKHLCQVENCNKEFFSLAHWKVHKYSHTHPHVCSHSQCRRKFGTSTELRTHKQSHMEERPHQCSECSESFRIMSTLLRHKILVHGASKYKCEYCDKEYMDKSMLQIHKTIHENTGIACGICDKVLGSKSLWRRHQIVHSKELSFICEECGKGFTSQQGLKRHSAIHGGEKKYKCQFCEKSFLFSKYLADHERIHTGERPFTCDICGRGFSQRGSLGLHKKKAHGDISTDANAVKNLTTIPTSVAFNAVEDTRYDDPTNANVVVCYSGHAM